MKILVLYSWENNSRKATEWAMALCLELNKYINVDADCDMLFEPESNITIQLKEKINNADGILVIVTKSYNDKIQNKYGMVSYEEELYREFISKNQKVNNILFVLKEKEINLPISWENYQRVDLSLINQYDFDYISSKEQKALFDKIIKFFFGISEWTTCDEKQKKRNIPLAKKVKSFDKLFKSYEKNSQELSKKQQEKKLIDFLNKNANQYTFVYDYIRCGLSSDLNLNGRMTPEVFLDHFFVKRPDNNEKQYSNAIRELFNSPLHNTLCVQSDGGSGKSIFIHTLCHRDEQKHGTKYNYTHILFDLSNLLENNALKEELLFQRLKKEYRKMSQEDLKNIEYIYQWRENFMSCIKDLDRISFESSPNLFNLNDFQEKLTKVIREIIPKNELEDWYIGYSRRIHSINSINGSENNILFIILLTVFTLILNCKPPKSNKGERYIIVFDNIETYDNGDLTQNIAYYVQACHSFLKKIFMELGKSDDFFKKFTFVLVLRTSTAIPFGSLQANLWGNDKYIQYVNFFDFTTEALIKKLNFLKKIRDYKNTVLFKELYLILSILIPKRIIDDCLENGKDIEYEYRYFTSKRLLPLFNNNFRTAMEYLYRSILSEKNHEIFLKKMEELKYTQKNLYDYSINEIRMVFIRDIFNELREYEYFDAIGFSGLSGSEEHSMTRMVLSFLYWDEVKNHGSNCDKKYNGIDLYTLVNTFRYFCTKDQLSEILYDLSIYANRKPMKKYALNAWGNLIVFKDLNSVLNETEFQEAIDRCFKSPKKHINHKVYVRLSDAGLCFTQYYMRSFEFLVSRSKNSSELPSLILLNNDNQIEECLSDIYNIISNCIDKMIHNCESICTLYGNKKDDCVLKNLERLPQDLFSCSLFIRYQECLDLIRESLDYIDRYRIIVYINTGNVITNEMLLNQLQNYYGLYNIVKEKMQSKETSNSINDFIAHWKYPSNRKFNDIIKNSKRIEKIRLIQSYYVNDSEDIAKAISKLKNNPCDTLFNVISEMCNIIRKL